MKMHGLYKLIKKLNASVNFFQTKAFKEEMESEIMKRIAESDRNVYLMHDIR